MIHMPNSLLFQHNYIIRQENENKLHSTDIAQIFGPAGVFQLCLVGTEFVP